MIIHLCSYTLDQKSREGLQSYLEEVQNMQMARVFMDLKKFPEASIIYICSTQIKEELIAFYCQLFGFGLEKTMRQVYFAVPSSFYLFHKRLPLSSVLWYSGDTLHRIKTMVFGRTGYIVPMHSGKTT